MATFFYVYILQSHVDSERFYTGRDSRFASEAKASQLKASPSHSEMETLAA